MGNCQAAEAATVVIVHPGNKVERVYWSVSAHEIMNKNPGNYVAVIVAGKTTDGGGGSMPERRLKLLRPDDVLFIGHVYQLISFEDVLKEFSSKKSVKMGKMVDERGLVAAGKGRKRRSGRVGAGDRQPVAESVAKPKSDNLGLMKIGHDINGLGISGSFHRGMVRPHGGSGQWKPALQSIAEV